MSESAARWRLARWMVRWGVLMGLWLALTDTSSSQELLAGAVAAAIAASIGSVVRRPGRSGTLRTVAALGRLGPALVRPLVRLVLDTGIVAAALARQLTGRRVGGRFRLARYRPGPERRSAAGRALTEAWGSLPANRYVVGINEEAGTILVHELVRSDEPLDPLGRE